MGGAKEMEVPTFAKNSLPMSGIRQADMTKNEWVR